MRRETTDITASCGIAGKSDLRNDVSLRELDFADKVSIPGCPLLVEGPT